MNLFTLLRRIHLYSGLVLLTFVIMYFVSGYPMIHHSWFPNPDPVTSTRMAPLTYAGTMEPEEYSLYLQETFDLRGKRQPGRRMDDGSWRFRYVRPGTFHEALVTAAGDSVRIFRREENARTTVVGFHRLHGYGGGWLYDIWVVLYDLASLSLIVFSLTGIYLWYRLTRRRLLGWVFLAISYGYAGVTILYLMYAP